MKTKFIQYSLTTMSLLAALLHTGCGKKEGSAPSSGGATPSTPAASTPVAAKTTLQVTGSDTMVNLAQAWAEAYHKVDPGVSIEVGGGGSGVGIAALINGTINIANSSRDMKADEKAKAKSTSGKDAKEYTV